MAYLHETVEGELGLVVDVDLHRLCGLHQSAANQGRRASGSTLASVIHIRQQQQEQHHEHQRETAEEVAGREERGRGRLVRSGRSGKIHDARSNQLDCSGGPRQTERLKG